MTSKEEQAELRKRWAATPDTQEPDISEPVVEPVPIFDPVKLEQAIAGAADRGEISAAIPTTSQLVEERDRIQSLWEQGDATLEELQEAADRVTAEEKIPSLVPTLEVGGGLQTVEEPKPVKKVEPTPISTLVPKLETVTSFNPEMTSAQIQQKEKQAVATAEKQYTDEYTYTTTDKDGKTKTLSLQEVQDRSTAQAMLGIYTDPKTGELDIVAASRDLGKNKVEQYLKDARVQDAEQLAIKATYIAATTVKLQTGELVPKDFYGNLDKSQQTEIQKTGFTTYMGKHYVKLSDGSYIDKTTFEGYPTQMQAAIMAEGVTVLDRYEATVGMDKFTLGKELGIIPAGAIYAGADKKGEPQYYEPDKEQMDNIEKALKKDTANAPLYFSRLLNRAGIATTATSSSALQSQFNSLSDSDKTRVLSTYRYQAAEEEGRVVSTDPWEMGLVVIGDTGEKIKEAVTSATASLAPGLAPLAIGATAVVTTLGEMAVMFPVAIGYVISDPRRIQDLAIGIKDFVYQSGKEAVKGDPWAIGEMVTIVGALYLGRAPIVNAVKKVSVKTGNGLASALERLNKAITKQDPVAIRKAGVEIQSIATEAKSAGVDTVTTDAIKNIGEKAVRQADNLSTVSTKTMDNLKVSVENAGGYTDVGKSTIKYKPQEVQIADTKTKRVLGPEDVGMDNRMFREYVKYVGDSFTEGKPTVSPEIYKMARARDFNELMSGVTKLAKELRVDTKMQKLMMREVVKVREIVEALAAEEQRLQRALTPVERLRIRKLWEVAEKRGLGKDAFKDWELKELERLDKLDKERAADIVRKAQENEAKVAAMAEASIRELQKMSESLDMARLLQSMSTSTIVAALATTQTKALIDTLAKLSSTELKATLARLDPALQNAVTAALAAKTSTQAKAAVATAQATAQQVAAATLASIATATQAAVATSTALATATSTAAKTEALTEVISKAATEVVGATATETATKTDIETIVDTVTDIVTKAEKIKVDKVKIKSIKAKIADKMLQKPKKPKKPRRIFLPKPDKDKVSRKVSIVYPDGTVAWRMGKLHKNVWHILEPPYGQAQYSIVTSDTPPKGTKVVLANNVAATIRELGGKLGRDIKIDIGAFDMHLTRAKGKPVTRFYRDVKGRTKNPVTAKGASVSSGMR